MAIYLPGLLTVARRFAGGWPELVKSGRMDSALRAIWDHVGGQLPLDDQLSGTGLRARLHEADGKDIVLVTLPRPEHGAEAYFVAVVVAEDRLADYFVLEHGWTPADEPRTVLCKWDDEVRLDPENPGRSDGPGHLNRATATSWRTPKTRLPGAWRLSVVSDNIRSGV